MTECLETRPRIVSRQNFHYLGLQGYCVGLEGY